MSKRLKKNKAYVVWIIYYLIVFFPLIPFYLITFLLAITTPAEGLLRKVFGIRPLRLKSEKERLQPIFDEVYGEVTKKIPRFSKNIKLYISEDIDVNAFAFGNSTLVLTKGSIELLSDECLKGFIAHEFGHFAHGDARVSLFISVFNLPMLLIMKYLTGIKESLDKPARNSIITVMFKTAFDFVYYLFKGIEFIGDLIINHAKRKSEYDADSIAVKFGFAEELAEVLNQVYQVSFKNPGTIKEQLKSTHPPLTTRIERVEKYI